MDTGKALGFLLLGGAGLYGLYKYLQGQGEQTDPANIRLDSADYFVYPKGSILTNEGKLGVDIKYTNLGTKAITPSFKLGIVSDVAGTKPNDDSPYMKGPTVQPGKQGTFTVISRTVPNPEGFGQNWDHDTYVKPRLILFGKEGLWKETTAKFQIKQRSDAAQIVSSTFTPSSVVRKGDKIKVDLTWKNIGSGTISQVFRLDLENSRHATITGTPKTSGAVGYGLTNTVTVEGPVMPDDWFTEIGTITAVLKIGADDSQNDFKEIERSETIITEGIGEVILVKQKFPSTPVTLILGEMLNVIFEVTHTGSKSTYSYEIKVGNQNLWGNDGTAGKDGKTVGSIVMSAGTNVTEEFTVPVQMIKEGTNWEVEIRVKDKYASHEGLYDNVEVVAELPSEVIIGSIDVNPDDLANYDKVMRGDPVVILINAKNLGSQRATAWFKVVLHGTGTFDSPIGDNIGEVDWVEFTVDPGEYTDFIEISSIPVPNDWQIGKKFYIEVYRTTNPSQKGSSVWNSKDSNYVLTVIDEISDYATVIFDIPDNSEFYLYFSPTSWSYTDVDVEWSLDPGTYDWRLVKEGYQDNTGTFTFVAGKTYSKTVNTGPLISEPTVEFLNEPTETGSYLEFHLFGFEPWSYVTIDIFDSNYNEIESQAFMMNNGGEVYSSIYIPTGHGSGTYHVYVEELDQYFNFELTDDETVEFQVKLDLSNYPDAEYVSYWAVQYWYNGEAESDSGMLYDFNIATLNGHPGGSCVVSVWVHFEQQDWVWTQEIYPDEGDLYTIRPDGYIEEV